MAYTYRTITDQAAATESLLRDGAKEAFLAAYQTDVELVRFSEAMKSLTAAQRAALASELASRKTMRRDAQARAARKEARLATPLTVEEKKQAAKGFHEQWLPGLEREHLTHATKLAERTATLAIPTGAPNAPTAEERARLTVEVANHTEALKVIESALAVSGAATDALVAGTPDPTVGAAGKA